MSTRRLGREAKTTAPVRPRPTTAAILPRATLVAHNLYSHNGRGGHRGKSLRHGRWVGGSV